MPRMRQLTIALITLCMSLLATADDDSNPAAGSDYAQPDWAAMFRNAEWVAQLHIESVGQLVNPSLSRNQIIAIDGYRYSAVVVKSWKGDHGDAIRFQVRLNDCPYGLQVDGEYIVFGSSDVRGLLGTDSCDKIIPVEQSELLRTQLEQMLAGG